MIAATSRQAYESLKERGALTDGQRKIMLWFHGQPKGAAYTRAQISQRAKLPLQSVCGRCNELVKLGYLEELSIVACPVTGNPAHQLRIVQPKTAAPAPVRAGESAIPQTDSPPLPSIAPPVAAAHTERFFGQDFIVTNDGYETWYHKDGTESRIRACTVMPRGRGR